VGVWTIGYGHTGPASHKGNVISEDQAEDLLREDMSESEYFVGRYIEVELNQDQFDALVSFTFNVGGGALAKSTLRRKLNDGDYDGAANEFIRWNKGTVNGKKVVLPGLTRRRRSEQFLFKTGNVKFFDGRGIIDPDHESSLEIIAVTNLIQTPSDLPDTIGGGAGFLATAGISTCNMRLFPLSYIK